MSSKWKAEPLPDRPIHLFIGVLSVTNHFAERMAIRKTWMQSAAIKSANVVALIPNVTAAYIMKCDDDTFIRVDTVLKAIEGIFPRRSLYMGNLNLLHRPLRTGKWVVSYEEWPEEVYPPYANGLGYVISSDIAKFIVPQHGNQSLRLFKMEDVCECGLNNLTVAQPSSTLLWMHGRLLHCTLPIPEADDLPMGQVIKRRSAHCCNFV